VRYGSTYAQALSTHLKQVTVLSLSPKIQKGLRNMQCEKQNAKET